MSATAIQSVPVQPKKHSVQMRAILIVLAADPDLKQMIEPHIDLQNESIYWSEILKIPCGSGHKAAITWLYGLWVDEQHPEFDVFSKAHCMDRRLQPEI